MEIKGQMNQNLDIFFLSHFIVMKIMRSVFFLSREKE